MALSVELSSYLADRLFPSAIQQAISPADAYRSLLNSGFSMGRSTFYSKWAQWVTRIGSRQSLETQLPDVPIPHSYHELASRSQVFNYVYVFRWEVYDPLRQTWVERGASVSSPLRQSPNQALASLLSTIQGEASSYGFDSSLNVRDVRLTRASKAAGLRAQGTDPRSIEDIITDPTMRDIYGRVK